MNLLDFEKNGMLHKNLITIELLNVYCEFLKVVLAK